MPKYVMDLKKCWGAKKCLGGFFWGGRVVMPKYFTDLKNVGGGMPTNLWT